jgi:hypothetical protein
MFFVDKSIVVNVNNGVVCLQIGVNDKTLGIGNKNDPFIVFLN